MTRVEFFKIEHLENFIPKWEFKDFEEHMVANLHDDSRELFVLLDDEKVYAIIGWNHVRRRVAEAWSIPSKDIEQCGLSYVKTLKKLIYNYLPNVHNVIRIELTTSVAWDQGLKWGKLLGFELEGIAKKWDGKEDHYLFGKVL